MASDGILSELDVLAMFSAQPEDPWLIRDAIDDLPGVSDSGRFLDEAPHFLRVRQRISGRCNSVSTVHTFVKRFSDQMDNFDSETVYQYVEECLRSRVVLVAKSLGTPSSIAELLSSSVAFHVRPPYVQSFPSLFQGFRAEPWFNVSGKDLFFSAHVDEVRVHSAALNVHNSGFTMTEPTRNIFCNWFWEETKDGVCSVRSFFSPACTTSSQSECAEDFEPSHLLADTCVAVCPEGAMRLADSSCDNASGLFQVWYIRALSIKQEDLILSIEVTAYTSADQPVKHVAGSGEVYMDFGTAMEISVVTVSANGSTGSNTQIMLRVVSLEEELLDVPEYQGVPIEEWTTYLFHKRVNHFSDRPLACVSCVNSVGSSVPQEDILACKSKGSVHTPLGLCGVTAGSTVAVAFEPAGPGSLPPAWPNSGESVQASTTCGDRRRRSCCLRILACPFSVGSFEACDHCRDCSGPSPDDFRALSRRKSPWTLASSFLMT